VNVLIVDDEPPARSRLRQLLEEAGEHRVVGEAENGRQALEMTQQLAPDVVLLDISMPGLSGIETARHMSALENPPCVVFATAHDRYALDAFDAGAVGYVLKPVRRERLSRALDQAARLTAALLGEVGRNAGFGERQHVCARVRGELKLIPIGDVEYFQADQKYVRVHHAKGEDLIDDSLKTLEEEFAARFVRIHRAALVAVDRIESLRKGADGQTEVALREDTRSFAAGPAECLVVSRRHLAEVKRRIRGE
jgi:two-component system, LytTR family, response regulator AlgR